MPALSPRQQPPSNAPQREQPDRPRRRRDGGEDHRKAVAGIVELLSRGFVTAAAVTFFVAGVVLLAVLLLT